MKFINEYTGVRTGRLCTYNYVVTEASTAYYVTLYRLGYENPCVKEFKVRKKKTVDHLRAVGFAISWYENDCAIG